jgi:hypothetical protein
MNDERSQESTINSPVESTEGDIIIFFVSEDSTSTSSSPLTIESQGLQILHQALMMATNTSEVTMPDGTEIEVHDKAQAVNDLAEFVQITSAERLKLVAKQQADLRYTNIRKKHDLFKKMDFASTNLDEQVGFHATLESAERQFGKFYLHLIFNIVEPDRDIRENILPSLKPGSGYRKLFQWYAVPKVVDITTSNQWHGIDQNKATFSVLTSSKPAAAFLGKVKSHNWGAPDYLPDSPEPFDQGKIEANKKRHQYSFIHTSRTQSQQCQSTTSLSLFKSPQLHVSTLL